MRLAALVGVGVLAILPAPAAAAERPTPGCQGMQVTDPAGDHHYLGAPADAVDGSDALDILGFFLRTSPDGAMTASFEVGDADIGGDVPPGTYGVIWTAWFSDRGGNWAISVNQYTRPFGDERTASISFHPTESGGELRRERVPLEQHPGRPGLFTAALGALRPAPGARLGDFRVYSAVAYALVPYYADQASSDASYRVVACAAATTPPPLTAPAAGAVDLTVTPRRARAGARSLRAFVSASAPLTRVRASLLRGRSRVATAALPSLHGGKVLRLRAGRPLRGGRHTLVVSGRTADGRLIERRRVVRVPYR